MNNENSPLCLVATVKLKPGLSEKFQEAAARVIEPTRNEAGNLTYLFHQSETDPTEFVFYEQWKTPADLDLHMKSDHMRSFFKEVGPYFEAGFPQLRKYELIA